jgi:hypothetical protein
VSEVVQAKGEPLEEVVQAKSEPMEEVVQAKSEPMDVQDDSELVKTGEVKADGAMEADPEVDPIEAKAEASKGELTQLATEVKDEPVDGNGEPSGEME